MKAKILKNKFFFAMVGVFALCAVGAFALASFVKIGDAPKDNQPAETADIVENTESTEATDDAELTDLAQDEEEPAPITEPDEPAPEDLYPNKPKYYVKVNRLLNVVMVYTLDRNGEYTKLAKTFVSSNGKPGSETIVGTFTVTDRYEALYLVGNVWGQYAVRINGPYFFHSVPYFSKGNPNWDDLEYLEYNKLGEGASAGCVRMAAVDAKWIYDNIPYGTTVEIYDAETLPEGVVKPTPIKIDVNSPNRGWDPTDPNPANPWN